MAKVRVPSLQHMARNWERSPELVSKKLLHLAAYPPTFSYRELYSAVREMLIFGTSIEQVSEGICCKIKRADVQKNFLEVLPLVAKHFEGVRPTFVQQVARCFYPIGRGLMIPFDPPLIYGSEGEIHFPWFSFWKSNPLDSERLSLFVSVVDEVLLQDPDLEEVAFNILDFSADRKTGVRALKILSGAEIPRLSLNRRTQMLDIFAEGLLLAQSDQQYAKETSKGVEISNDDNSDQLPLF